MAGSNSSAQYQNRLVIAGAGPAGLAASLSLCRMGISHILLEKSVFPRDKICGDALSGKVLDNLHKIDPGLKVKFEAEAKRTAVGSYGVQFIAPNGSVLEVPFKSNLDELASPPGYISKRVHFDHFLFSQVDQNICSFRQQTTLADVRRESNSLVLDCAGINTNESIRCEVLIASEGDRSVAAKKLAGYTVEDEHYCAGLRRYYRGVEGMHSKGFIELHFLRDILPGYFWLFPLPNGEVNAGIGMLRKEIKRRRINLRSVFDKIIQTHPVISKRFHNAIPLEEPRGWGLPLGSKKRSLAGDNYMLAGDAASLIDPFTGEGIGNALLSGRLAAAKAAEALKQQRFDGDFFSGYTDEVYSKVEKELRLSTKMQKLSAHAWLFNFVTGKAASNRALQETIISMFEDVGLRKRLADPRFYFRLLFNR